MAPIVSGAGDPNAELPPGMDAWAAYFQSSPTKSTPMPQAIHTPITSPEAMNKAYREQQNLNLRLHTIS